VLPVLPALPLVVIMPDFRSPVPLLSVTEPSAVPYWLVVAEVMMVPRPRPRPPLLAVPMVRPVLPSRSTVALAPVAPVAVAMTLPTVRLPPVSWT
jgi:hypothetical protein